MYFLSFKLSCSKHRLAGLFCMLHINHLWMNTFAALLLNSCCFQIIPLWCHTGHWSPLTPPCWLLALPSAATMFSQMWKVGCLVWGCVSWAQGVKLRSFSESKAVTPTLNKLLPLTRFSFWTVWTNWLDFLEADVDLVSGLLCYSLLLWSFCFFSFNGLTAHHTIESHATVCSRCLTALKQAWRCHMH